MRLVRGSILSSKPCSRSKAAGILRRFLFSDAGTDISVKSFLKRAARSLESKRDVEGSSLRKPKRKRLEETTAVPYPEEGTEAVIADVEDGKHRKKKMRQTEADANEQFSQIAEPKSEVSDKSIKHLMEKHSEYEEGPIEMKVEFDVKPEKIGSDLYDATPVSQKKQRKMLKEDEFLTDAVTPSPGMKQPNISERKHKKKGDAVKQEDEKTDLELKGIPATQKKSKKSRSADKSKHQQASEEDKLSSKNSEKYEASVNGVEGVDEPDHSRHSKKKMLGEAAEAEVGDHELNCKKKRKKENTPR